MTRSSFWPGRQDNIPALQTVRPLANPGHYHATLCFQHILQSPLNISTVSFKTLNLYITSICY